MPKASRKVKLQVKVSSLRSIWFKLPRYGAASDLLALVTLGSKPGVDIRVSQLALPKPLLWADALVAAGAPHPTYMDPAN